MKTNFSSVFMFYNLLATLSMAATIWGEAEGEPWKGKLAVGWVIKNRVTANRSYFGKGYVGVVLKRKQFSCFNKTLKLLRKGKLKHDRVANMLTTLDTKMSNCLAAAEATYHGIEKDPTNGAMWFVNKRLKGKMRWMRKLEHTVDIGNHSFYREEKDAKSKG